jgi:hypothetical protein
VLASDELNRKSLAPVQTTKDEEVLPGSSWFKHRADIVQNKDQQPKIAQNNKQYLFGKNYNMCQQKAVNVVNTGNAGNQPYLDQRKKSPTNANLLHSINAEVSDKQSQPWSFNLFRSQRSKLIQQQKDKFRHKYSKFTSDSKQPKDDSIRLDPLINPSRLCFSKTKAPDEIKIMTADK